MARKRMIDPSFWIDEKLGMLDVISRLLFMGLISNADDDGRLVGHPSLIKSIIFPYDQDITVVDIITKLQELAKLNMIILYKNNNQSYIQVTHFKKYQTINKPTPSKYPSYDDSNSVVELRQPYRITTA